MSISSLALEKKRISFQEDGSRLVGQCEISHPVRSPRSEPQISITDDLDDESDSQNFGFGDQEDFDPFSPSDEEHGGSRKGNVFFAASAKEDGGAYEKLRSRISRKLLSLSYRTS